MYIEEIFTTLGTATLVLLLTLVVYLGLRAFEFSGFTPLESFILITSPILAFFIPQNYLNYLVYQQGILFIGLNLFGFLIPVIISIRIIAEKRISLKKAIPSILVITLLSYELSVFNPSIGISVNNFYLIPVIASLISILLYPNNLRKIAPLAYISGSIGVLIGADLLRLNEILGYSPTRPISFIMGGAGVLDAIFLTGIISVIINIFFMLLNPSCRRLIKEKDGLF